MLSVHLNLRDRESKGEPKDAAKIAVATMLREELQLLKIHCLLTMPAKEFREIRRII